MAHKDPISGIGSSFNDYVRKTEAELDDDALALLERLRSHFSLGAELIELRKQKGMTQAQLSTASGIHQSEISRIEHGVANPSRETLDAIGAVFRMRIGLVPVADSEPVAAK